MVFSVIDMVLSMPLGMGVGESHLRMVRWEDFRRFPIIAHGFDGDLREDHLRMV